MNRFACLVILCALAVNSAHAQKLYKHVDEKGVVTYTDRPEEAKQKPMTVGNTTRNGDRTEKANSNIERTQGRGDAAWKSEQQPLRARKEYEDAAASGAATSNNSGNDNSTPAYARPQSPTKK